MAPTWSRSKGLAKETTRGSGGRRGSGNSPAYFLSTNRNKRSVTVDIGTLQGQRLIRDLAEKADILVENFKTGTLARYDLDPAELMSSNEGLIVCSISAFGRSGSRASEPGYDAMVQASAV